MKGAQNNPAWLAVAGAMIFFGTFIFTGSLFGRDTVQTLMGLVLLVVGFGIALLQVIGPFEAHGHGGGHGHGDQHGSDDELGDPNQRARGVTLLGWVAVEYVIFIIIWRWVYVEAGLTGNAAFQELGWWFISISLLVWLTDLVKIPEHPANVAQVVFLGRRVKWCFKPEGWRHFPLRWLGLFRFILQNVQTVDFDIGGKAPDVEAVEVMTPDKVKSWIDLEVTFEVSNPVVYQNNEGEAGVKDRFHNIIGSRLRVWAISGKEGPDGWFSLKGARIYALNAIARALFDERQLPHIDSGPAGLAVPSTEFLLHHHEAPGWPRTERPAHLDQALWDGWVRQYNALMANPGENIRISGLLAERRKTLQDLRDGNAHLSIKSLGIAVTRISLTTIRSEGKVEEAGSDAEKERLEKVSQQIEQRNVVALAAAMMQPAGPVNPATGKVKLPGGGEVEPGLGLTDASEALKVAQRITGKLTSGESIFTIDVTAGGKSVAEAIAGNPALAALLLKFVTDSRSSAGKRKGGK